MHIYMKHIFRINKLKMLSVVMNFWISEEHEKNETFFTGLVDGLMRV